MVFRQKSNLAIPHRFRHGLSNIARGDLRAVVAAGVMLSFVSVGSAAAAGETSIYTKMDFDKDCLTVEPNEVGARFVCSGYKGWPIYFEEGDLRQSIFFGHLGPWFMDKDGSTAFVTFGSFNYIGETVEWRIDDKGVPFAAIVRYTLQTSLEEDAVNPDPKKNKQVLVVSTIGQPGVGVACYAAMIDASLTPNANEVARKFADEQIRKFRCGDNPASWQGTIPDPKPSMTEFYPGAEPDVQ
jgi:hypothetical protein